MARKKIKIKKNSWRLWY